MHLGFGIGVGGKVEHFRNRCRLVDYDVTAVAVYFGTTTGGSRAIVSMIRYTVLVCIQSTAAGVYLGIVRGARAPVGRI